MVEVEIHNFQSIAHVKFQIRGFTALTGRSNIGKSAIVRAIQCALTGAVGTDFVRHGTDCERRLRGVRKCKCFSKVVITTDAVKVAWEKGDTVNRYLVQKTGETEPVIYNKIGRGTPDFLQPEFTPVKLGDTLTLAQVSEQFSPIFLLNQSGPAVADVLSDVARLDQINDAMRMVTKDRKGAVSTRKVREKDILEIHKSLKTYEGLDDALQGVSGVEASHKGVLEASERAERLQGFVDRATSLGTSLRALRGAVSPPMPDGDLESAADKVSQLNSFLEELASLHASREALEAAVSPSAPDGENLEESARRTFQVKRFYDSLSQKARRIRDIRGIEEVTLPDVKPIGQALEQAGQLRAWIQRLQVLQGRVDRWKDFDGSLPNAEVMRAALKKTIQLHRFHERLVQLKDTQKKVKDLLAAVEEERKGITKQVQDLGVCPTCSQDITADGCLHLGDS